jgi:uncharacterized protein YqhQ
MALRADERCAAEAHKYGGQAVLEGVMIKGKHHAAVAVRNEKGEIRITSKPVAANLKAPWKWPVVRGVITLWQTLSIGIWALDISAKESTGEEVDDPPWMMALTLVIAFGLGGVLFFYLPLLFTQAMHRFVPALGKSNLLFNLVDGLFRMTIFILYVVGIGFIPGIKRVFEYHGAEHKVVSAYEHDGLFSVEAALPHSTLHRRCGTAFLLTVMLVSIVVFSVIPKEQPFLMKFFWRLVLVPFIAGVSFEMIRFSDRPKGRWLAWFLSPGLALQKLTTREPDAEQIAVAAAALGEVLRLEGEGAHA